MPPSQSSGLRGVYIDDMSGREFEELCQRIYTIRGAGDEVEPTPAVNDGGKDLIIYPGKGKVFVECRHEPNAAQGTPDIRSLYAAIVSEGAESGVFVTTGRFSAQAVRYTSGLVPRSRLVAREELVGMAEEAGYRLIFGDEGDDETVYRYPAEDNEAVFSGLEAAIRPMVDLGKHDPHVGMFWSRTLEPFYLLVYVVLGGYELRWSDRKRAKPVTEGYLLLRATEPAAQGPEGPRAPIYGGEFAEPGIAVPLREFEVISPEDAAMEGAPFAIYDEDAWGIGAEHGRRLARRAGLPEGALVLRRVHRVMVPVYHAQIRNTTGMEARMSAVHLGRAIVLTKGANWRRVGSGIRGCDWWETDTGLE